MFASHKPHIIIHVFYDGLYCGCVCVSVPHHSHTTCIPSNTHKFIHKAHRNKRRPIGPISNSERQMWSKRKQKREGKAAALPK